MSLHPLKELLRRIPEDNEHEFLEVFLFELTIAFRGLRVGDDIREDRLPKSMRMFNEINHRVLNRIRDLRDGTRWSTRDYVPEMVAIHVGEEPMIAGYVHTALERTLAKYDA